LQQRKDKKGNADRRETRVTKEERERERKKNESLICESKTKENKSRKVLAM
jgi:hypothetical protein